MRIQDLLDPGSGMDKIRIRVIIPYPQYSELGTSLLYIERTLKSDEWSLIFWVKENECRAMSELS